eukprot:2366427-Rhodomonas_salina.1
MLLSSSAIASESATSIATTATICCSALPRATGMNTGAESVTTGLVRADSKYIPVTPTPRLSRSTCEYFRAASRRISATVACTWDRGNAMSAPTFARSARPSSSRELTR